MICDINNDAVANMTSYRNCGWKGTQMQQVIRFGTKGGGPDARIFYVYGHGPGGDKCAYWCDSLGSEQCFIQESLCQSDYTERAAYVNTSAYNGTTCDVFSWEDKLGPISMNSLTLWVAQGTATPKKMHRDVHPFGKELGTFDTHWLSFTEGAPPAAAFDVPGEATCEEGDPGTQCPQGATVRDHIDLFKRMVSVRRDA